MSTDLTSLSAWLRVGSGAGGATAIRYSLALGAVVFAAIARATWMPWPGAVLDPLIVNVLVILVAVWAGRGPALAATAFLTVIAWQVWPDASGGSLAPADAGRLATLAIGGVAMAVIGGYFHASRRAGYARRVEEVTSALSAGRTMRDTGGRVLAAACSAVGSVTGAVLRVDSGTGKLSPMCSAGRTPDMDTRWLRIALDPTFATGEAARTGRATLVRDLGEWSRRYPQTAPQAKASGLASALALPLVADGRVLGVLALSGVTLTDAPGEWAFVEAVQTQCAVAMARAEAYETDLRHRSGGGAEATAAMRAVEAVERGRADRLRTYLQHLQDVTAAFSRSATESEVAEAFVSAAEALFGARPGHCTSCSPAGASWNWLRRHGTPTRSHV